MEEIENSKKCTVDFTMVHRWCFNLIFSDQNRHWR